MNTQVKQRPTSETQTRAPGARPRPVWSEPTDDARLALPTRGKRGWITLMIVAAAAAVALVWLVAGNNSTPTPEPTQVPAFDSPGGNSLNIPVPRSQVQVDRPALDSPGGNSLNIPVPRPWVENPATTGATADTTAPGGEFLNME